MIEIIREYLIPFGVGAICMKLIDWFKDRWVQKKHGEIANLQEQRKSLYGPLHFLVSQNKQCFDLGNKVLEASIEESKGRQFSEAESERITTVSNDYSGRVREKNARIQKLLEENWHLIDEDDEDIFAAFLGSYTRMNVEAGDDASNRLPPSIQRMLDPIYFMPPGFAERVDSKWKAKRDRLDRLRNSWWR